MSERTDFRALLDFSGREHCSKACGLRLNMTDMFGMSEGDVARVGHATELSHGDDSAD